MDRQDRRSRPTGTWHPLSGLPVGPRGYSPATRPHRERWGNQQGLEQEERGGPARPATAGPFQPRAVARAAPPPCGTAAAASPRTAAAGGPIAGRRARRTEDSCGSMTPGKTDPARGRRRRADRPPDEATRRGGCRARRSDRRRPDAGLAAEGGIVAWRGYAVIEIAVVYMLWRRASESISQ